MSVPPSVWVGDPGLYLAPTFAVLQGKKTRTAKPPGFHSHRRTAWLAEFISTAKRQEARLDDSRKLASDSAEGLRPYPLCGRKWPKTCSGRCKPFGA